MIIDLEKGQRGRERLAGPSRGFTEGLLERAGRGLASGRFQASPQSRDWGAGEKACIPHLPKHSLRQRLSSQMSAGHSRLYLPQGAWECGEKKGKGTVTWTATSWLTSGPVSEAGRILGRSHLPLLSSSPRHFLWSPLQPFLDHTGPEDKSIYLGPSTLEP